MNAQILPFEEIRFVKTISVENLRHNEPFFGEIMYIRKASAEYWYKPVPADMTWQERFQRDVNGRPEDEYPSDLLDSLILKGVRAIYPYANIVTRGITFDVEREEMKKYLSHYETVDQYLVISPSAAGLTIGEVAQYVGKEFTEYTRTLTLLCLGEKAKSIFTKCEYRVNYSLAVSADVEKLLKDYDGKVFGLDSL